MSTVSLLFLFGPLVSIDQLSKFQSALHFTGSFSSLNNKILVFWKHGLQATIADHSEQFVHLHL